jgi:membrane-associated protein
MVKMNTAKFSFYNIVGSFLWACSMVSAGFVLGENAWVKENLEKIIIGIVLLTTGPVLIKLLTGRKKNNLQTAPVFTAMQKENGQENIKV